MTWWESYKGERVQGQEGVRTEGDKDGMLRRQGGKDKKDQGWECERPRGCKNRRIQG